MLTTSRRLLPGAVDDAEAFLSADASAKLRFDRVADLVDGFESAFGMELLATVHWVATHEGRSGLASVAEGVHQWNHRKRQFNLHHIEVALSTLRAKGWLEQAHSK